VTGNVLALTADLLHLLGSTFRSRAQLAAENLFLRKQLARYVERQVRPRRATDATRVALVLLSRLVTWRELLAIVRPNTLVRWHRELYRLFWRAKSPPLGRRPIPQTLHASSRIWRSPTARGVRSASRRNSG
jgi:putative transposase